MILIAIVMCEVGFWIAILGGLAARYLLRRPRLGAALLFGGLLIDVLLLVFVTIDLIGGATASWHHGLAAIYLGFSVAYGRRMVAWADVRFHHRFGGGLPPARLSGREYAVKCWADVVRTILAAVISAAVLLGLILLVQDPVRTEELDGLFPILALVVAAEVLWAISYTLWPKKVRPSDSGPLSH